MQDAGWPKKLSAAIPAEAASPCFADRATMAATASYAPAFSGSAGYHVRLSLLGRQEDLKRDPKEMARRWDEAIEPMSLQSLEGAQIIVDAIYGTGLRDDVSGVPAQIIEEVTARGLPVVAVDIPTGSTPPAAR